MILDAYNILIAAVLLVEFGMLLLVIRQRGASAAALGLLLLSLMATTAALWLPAEWQLADTLPRAVLFWAGGIVLTLFYGSLVLQDIVWGRVQRLWLGLGIVWLAAYLVAALLSPVPVTGWVNWPEALPTLPAVVVVVGLLGFNLWLSLLIFVRFFRASMPEIANRAVYWLAGAALLFLTVFLLTSASAVWMLLAAGLGAIVGLLATLSRLWQHLPDLRTLLFDGARSLALIAVTWVLLFAGLYFANRYDFSRAFNLPNPALSILVIGAIALMGAAIIITARGIINWLFQRILARTTLDLPEAIALYSQQVARAATLDEVVAATTNSLNRVLGLRRSALILINSTFRFPDAVELIVLDGGSTLETPRASGYLSKKSPIYHKLVVEKEGLTQYDVDYNPAYAAVQEEERAFFHSLGMSAYVPLVAEDRLIGLLAGGTKLNGGLYQEADMEMLFVIGHQVTTALRSARLIDDLQHLNDTMRVLNKRLENANSELEKLDAIKTDFITIASHELRTPLAQVRGYTDIIDSMMNGDDPGAQQMIQNLRKSTERMEELISAMLDVSQIDVNSMDLRFVRTAPATLVKLALEPLRDPVNQRNITIHVHDLEGLPNVEADLQRLTQALRNLFMNAIKFTPDGGRIDVSAYLESRPGKPESVVFKIQDTGVGIAAKDLPYIFQKFYRGFDTQLHSTGIYKFMGAGPGLGLTIAKGIIEGHGGEIWVESPGHSMTEFPGATFYVRLPLQPPEGSLRVLTFGGEEASKSSTSVNPQIG